MMFVITVSNTIQYTIKRGYALHTYIFLSWVINGYLGKPDRMLWLALYHCRGVASTADLWTYVL